MWDLSTLSASTEPPPLPPSCTINTSDPVHCLCWLKPGVLATTSSSSSGISLWGVGAHLEAVGKAGVRLNDVSTLYNPAKTVSCEVAPSVMVVSNGLLVTGNSRGTVAVIDTEKDRTTNFNDHKAAVTDIYAVSLGETLVYIPVFDISIQLTGQLSCAFLFD